MSYNAGTGLVYVPTTDRGADVKAPSEAGEGGEGLFGRLIAWDPVAQSARWSVEEENRHQRRSSLHGWQPRFSRARDWRIRGLYG